MNDALTATVVAGTALGLAIVLYATEAHLGNVFVALGGVVVLLSVGLMTVAISRVDGGHETEADASGTEPTDNVGE